MTILTEEQRSLAIEQIWAAIEGSGWENYLTTKEPAWSFMWSTYYVPDGTRGKHQELFPESTLEEIDFAFHYFILCAEGEVDLEEETPN